MKKTILYTLLAFFIPVIALAYQITVPSPTVNGQLLVGNGTTKNYSTTPSTGTSTIGNLGGMLNPTAFSGIDIGAMHNTGYAFAPSYGAGFFVPMATTSGGTWQFTTPILFNTANKPAVIHCAVGGQASNYATNGATLRYVATTGTSTAFNTSASIGANTMGIDGCNVQGTNGTTARITDGVWFGGTSGGFSGFVNNSDVSGFGTGVVFRPSTSFNLINNSNIHFNGRNISEPDTSGANCENMRITNSVIADSNNQLGGATDLNGMYVQESGNCQWNIGFTSIDDNQINYDQYGGSANVNTHVASHFENPDLHAYTMIVGNLTGGILDHMVTNLIGGDMMNDTVAGQPDQIRVSGNVNLLGFTSDNNNNVTGQLTRVVSALSSSTVVTWAGLTCYGANNGGIIKMVSTFVYGQVPCSPMGVGSDYGAPSFYVATSSATGIGSVGIATSSPSATFGNAVLNLGLNSLNGISNSASSTIRYTGIGQMEMKNTAGTVVCMYVVGTTPTVSTGACNN